MRFAFFFCNLQIDLTNHRAIIQYLRIRDAI